MKVHEALSAVMADVQAVGKTGYNSQQNFSFRGVDAVVDAVGPALREHKVLVTPRVLSKSHRDFETKNKALMHECIVEVEYTFTGPEGDTLVGSSIGESADSGDKGTAKAMSVAYRTWWLQALCIPTHEQDPDETSIERAAPRKAKPAKHAKQDIVWQIEKGYPGIDAEEVKAIAFEVWEWGGLENDAEVQPDVLDDLLAHINVVVTEHIRDESEAPHP